METENITWVITLESGTPKVEIVRKTNGKPMIECPPQKEIMPEWDSGIYLNKEKGMRINMIRLIYSLCLLNCLHDKYGNKISDYKVFQAFGVLFHMDLSNYSNDLNRCFSDSTSIEKQTEFFRKMENALRVRLES